MEIAAARVVHQRPRAAGVEPLGDDDEAGQQAITAQGRVGAIDALQLLAQRAGVVFGAQHALAEQALREDLAAELTVLGEHFGDTHSLGQRGGDDRAGRGAGDQVEVVRQAKVVASAMPLGEHLLDAFENAQRENAAQAAAVEREDALRQTVGGKMLVAGSNRIAHAALHSYRPLMHGHEVALVVEIIGGQPEEVMVFPVMGELPDSAVAAAAQAAGNHLQVAPDIRGRQIELLQTGARQWQQHLFEQLAGRYVLSVEPPQLRVETVPRGTVEIVLSDGERQL
ncbi:MAG: hypothetical protein CAPSK01_000627 [Candidatus Accumulibacter vicinus]|uniref:Uncharacterized protein n=1 Tax=Candidatus Accumulibacter vicinus TaxID=2954382 RepID=A0A084Y4C4_9PROT|nr:MAG: hypothetical protein CAPSK01_000627 [Candidatus Accumulibacter vicinus]